MSDERDAPIFAIQVTRNLHTRIRVSLRIFFGAPRRFSSFLFCEQNSKPIHDELIFAPLNAALAVAPLFSSEWRRLLRVALSDTS